MELSTLLNIDQYLLLSLNGSDSLFWDGCMLVYTSMAVWMPLAFVLLCVLLKNNNIRDFFLLVVLVAVVATLTDTISSGICKPFFERWRPTNDPVLMYAVDVVNETRGGRYGFTSSHAANSFGIATFIMLLIRNRALSCSLIIWASMNAFTRIYLGVHYPGDILAGTLIGVLVGFAMYRLYVYIQNHKRRASRRDWISDHYTKSGYLVSDVYFLLLVMYLTFAAIPMISFFTFVY
ncbi:MAG: phosphatase PAP2 family protein [Bacteroidaceae bacterium]|nr:phosphatase PAP2 family protein [Bacteroidaceae bacterium]